MLIVGKFVFRCAGTFPSGNSGFSGSCEVAISFVCLRVWRFCLVLAFALGGFAFGVWLVDFGLCLVRVFLGIWLCVGLV